MNGEVIWRVGEWCVLGGGGAGGGDTLGDWVSNGNSANRLYVWVRIKARTIGNDKVDRLKSVGGGGGGGDAPNSNSKHWFTTSFLQPLPYLVTP